VSSKNNSPKKRSGSSSGPPLHVYAKWQSRCFRNADSDLWYVKLQYRGRRETFALRTANRAEAGVRARSIFMALRTLGWAETLAKYKPNAIGALRSTEVKTVGDFCAAVEGIYTGQKRSVRDCVRNFRRLAADIAGIDRNAPGWQYTAEKIDLDLITRARIETWRVGYLERRSEDLEQTRSTRTTCNSILRMSKALFTRERLELIGLADFENPFAKIKLLPGLDHRFRGGLDPGVLMRQALAELSEETEMLKILLLALCCGLRRMEIDRLEWSAFNFAAGTLHIGASRYLHPKSEKTIGDIDLDPELVTLFRGFYARRRSEFVIESKLAPKLGVSYPHYRAETLFGRLNNWLREHGVRARTPLHTLRKMFGSLINDQYGLHSASLALRHASVATTAAHYVSKRARVTAGLGGVLAAESKVISLNQKAS
jgi:integrase